MAKAKNTATELKGKSPTELQTMLVNLRKEQFNMRFQRATGQLANTARVNAVRKEIARIQTQLNAKPAAPKKAATKGAK